MKYWKTIKKFKKIVFVMNHMKDIEDMYKLFIDKKFSYFTADKLNSQNVRRSYLCSC